MAMYFMARRPLFSINFFQKKSQALFIFLGIFESLIPHWGIGLNVRPSEAESGLVNLQAGEPVCHPAACKLITLESLSIFHDPVYKKIGSGFYGGAIWPKIGHFPDQKGLTPNSA
jgi:hypothetical protein